MDQLYAQRFGQDTPIPSMQLCIEDVDQSGGCGYGYSCVYTDSISWATPTKPLPMTRDPRVVFNQIFNVIGSGREPNSRQRLEEERSILDWVMQSAQRFERRLGAADRIRLADYLDNVREIERRIQAIERRNSSGDPRELPLAPEGVPDSFAEHVKLMFDLQMLAFRSDVTRVVSLKLGRDGSNRVYAESGSRSAFHVVSHHGENPDRVREFAKINAYHVSLLPHLLKQLQETPDGDGTMLDNSVVIYGSPMGNPEPAQPQARAVPIRRTRRRSQFQGGVHLRAKNGTPLSNVMLSLLHTLGLDELPELRRQRGHVFVGMIRHAFRTISRMPGLAAVVVLSLGVGIGVNTAVFSWIQAIVLKPIPGVAGSGRFYHVEPKSDTGTYPGHVVGGVSATFTHDCRRSTSWWRFGWRPSTWASRDEPSAPTRSSCRETSSTLSAFNPPPDDFFARTKPFNPAASRWSSSRMSTGTITSQDRRRRSGRPSASTTTS